LPCLTLWPGFAPVAGSSSLPTSPHSIHDSYQMLFGPPSMLPTSVTEEVSHPSVTISGPGVFTTFGLSNITL
jgi:hypothetical protein